MISGIQHYCFCPRQWALIHIEQQWAENVHTVVGELMHKKVHDPTLKEKRNGVIIARALPVSSRKMGVSGECDLVEFHKCEDGIKLHGHRGLYSIYPVEYKKGRTKLTEEDRESIEKIHASFINSEKLRKHMRCLFTYGGMYLVCNSNLLYHASIPLNEDGSFRRVSIAGKEYWGRRLLEKVDQLVRTAYFGEEGDEKHSFAKDYVWYLWCGPDAPSFDKDKMATFERYFLTDKDIQRETKGFYYTLRDEVDVCDRILREFDVDPNKHAHIINGHVPVKTLKGEQPVKAGGKLLVIDGGFSKAYQPETGIAGYTLVYHSHGLQLVQHEPFQSRQKAIEEGQDIKSTTFLVEFNTQRMMVKDTDKGEELSTQIRDLEKLLVAYRTGLIKEKQ